MMSAGSHGQLYTWGGDFSWTEPAEPSKKGAEHAAPKRDHHGGCLGERLQRWCTGAVDTSPNSSEPNAKERGGERGLCFDNGVALNSSPHPRGGQRGGAGRERAGITGGWERGSLSLLPLEQVRQPGVQPIHDCPAVVLRSQQYTYRQVLHPLRNPCPALPYPARPRRQGRAAAAHARARRHGQARRGAGGVRLEHDGGAQPRRPRVPDGRHRRGQERREELPLGGRAGAHAGAWRAAMGMGS